MDGRLEKDLYEFMGATKTSIENIEQTLERQETKIDNLNTRIEEVNTKVLSRPSFEKVEKQINDHANKCEGAKPKRILPDTLQGWLAVIGSLIVIVSSFYLMFFAFATPQIQTECKAAIKEIMRPDDVVKKHDE